MATLEARMKASMRRGSAILISENPLEGAPESAEKPNYAKENLFDCTQIEENELRTMVEELTRMEDNNRILLVLEETRKPFLFSSTDLQKLLEVTPSVKTKLKIVSMIGPRLSDPRAKMDEIIASFRFSEEKEHVGDVLKARILTLASEKFVHSDSRSIFRLSTGGRGSPTGRGGAGRGRGFGLRAASTNSPLINRHASLPTRLLPSDIFGASGSKTPEGSVSTVTAASTET